MESNEILNQFSKFLETNHLSNVLDNFRKGKPYVYIDFNEISLFNPELGNELLADPEETLKLFSTAIEQKDVPDVRVRITNLPSSCEIPIWEIRKQTKQFIKFQGYISKLGDNLLRPCSAVYICTACGIQKTVVSRDRMEKLPVPLRCSCGRQKTFKPYEINTLPSRAITVEEDMMEIGARQIPRQKIVILEHDLTNPELDIKILTGKKVIVNGWLEVFTINEKTGMMDTVMVCNSLEFIERGWGAIELKESEKNEFHDIASNESFISDMSQSIMPGIHGEEPVKYALLLQLVGANNVYDKHNFLEERGCIHIGLIGEPGCGKSKMARRLQKFWPIYRFTSAVTATGRGLIASVVYEKVLDKWVLVAGTIPTCNKGLVAIDELEKMNEDEYGYLNNAMNDLKVTITKVASGMLDTDVSIMATMNPDGRIFVPDMPIYQQIKLPPDLIDRFDLILPVKSSKIEESQRKIVRIGFSQRNQSDEVDPIIPEEKLIKYFAYARTFKPSISAEFEKVIEDRIIRFVRPSSSNEQHVSNRIFWVIFRLIEASARLHLRTEITVKDLNDVMDLLIYSYKEQNLLDANNILDYDRMERVDEKIANALPLVKQTIVELGKTMTIIPIDDVIKLLEGKVSSDKVDETIEKLRHIGEIFEPKRGFIQRL